MNTPVQTPRGPVFWISWAMGGGLIAYGLINLLEIPRRTHPTNWARYLIEGLVLHDLVLAPLICIGGFILARTLPARLRAPIQVAAIITGTIALASIPVVSGYGRLANNPTILPSTHYARNLAIVVAAVWIGCLAWLATRLREH